MGSQWIEQQVYHQRMMGIAFMRAEKQAEFRAKQSLT